jgi:hypothetical protein
MRWSDIDDKTLAEMRQAGKSFRLIGKALGRTETSCEARWHYKIKKAVAVRHSAACEEDGR